MLYVLAGLAVLVLVFAYLVLLIRLRGIAARLDALGVYLVQGFRVGQAGSGLKPRRIDQPG